MLATSEAPEWAYLKVMVKVHPARREAFEVFVRLMEAKMQKHDGDYGPAGWREPGTTVQHLRNRLGQELAELDSAGTAGQPWSGDEIARAATDVANLCFMIADLAGGLPTPAKADFTKPLEDQAGS